MDFHFFSGVTSELSCGPLGRLLESRLGWIAERKSVREGTICIIRESSDQLAKRGRGLFPVASIDLLAHDYGVNISCNIARTCPSVDGETLPSRRTKRSRSTVRIWSITTYPARLSKRHGTRNG